MNATAPVREPVTPAAADKLRDEIAQTLRPANALERMLVSQVAQSWERLQRAYELERQYFNGRDVAEIVRTKLEEFKAVTRYVTDCERAWRHALLNLEKTQRRRQRETLKADVAHAPKRADSRLKGTPASAPAVADIASETETSGQALRADSSQRGASVPPALVTNPPC